MLITLLTVLTCTMFLAALFLLRDAGTKKHSSLLATSGLISGVLLACATVDSLGFSKGLATVLTATFVLLSAFGIGHMLSNLLKIPGPYNPRSPAQIAFHALVGAPIALGFLAQDISLNAVILLLFIGSLLGLVGLFAIFAKDTDDAVRESDAENG